MSKKLKPGNMKDYEDAVWQYLIDHVISTKGGIMFVQTHLRDRYDWNRRLSARMSGLYRNDEIEVEKEINTERLSFKVNRRKSLKKTERMNEIQKSKNVLDIVMVYLYKISKRYIFKDI